MGCLIEYASQLTIALWTAVAVFTARAFIVTGQAPTQEESVFQMEGAWP